MKASLVFVIVFIFFASCQNPAGKQSGEDEAPVDTTEFQMNTSPSDKSDVRFDFEKVVRTDSLEQKEVFGYRFVIEGDFDGDGKKERLIEHYFSGITNKETNKFYKGLGYDTNVFLTDKKDNYAFLSSDNSLIDSLYIGGFSFGLSYLKNEGDLDGDGGDEISYVVDLADFSNLNTCYIMTYKNGKWKELYSFGIWDWQLPDLPNAVNQYGLFGTEGKILIPENDTINARLEKELRDFKGLVRKIKTNKIQVIGANDEWEMDSMIVDLKKLKNTGSKK